VRAADAVERRRQLHQHAVVAESVPLSADDACDDARRMGEFNPWQVPMGSKTQAALELMDVLVYRAERAEDAGETVTAALDIAFNGSLVTAVLLAQRLIGAKRGSNEPRPAKRTRAWTPRRDARAARKPRRAAAGDRPRFDHL
jgi:hypothetical protein